MHILLHESECSISRAGGSCWTSMVNCATEVAVSHVYIRYQAQNKSHSVQYAKHFTRQVAIFSQAAGKRRAVECLLVSVELRMKRPECNFCSLPVIFIVLRIPYSLDQTPLSNSLRTLAAALLPGVITTVTALLKLYTLTN